MTPATKLRMICVVKNTTTMGKTEVNIRRHTQPQWETELISEDSRTNNGKKQRLISEDTNRDQYQKTHASTMDPRGQYENPKNKTTKNGLLHSGKW